MSVETNSIRSGCISPPARSGIGLGVAAATSVSREWLACRRAAGSGVGAAPRRPGQRHDARPPRAPSRAARAQFSSIVTESTIPMIAASTGAPFFPSASPAARPSSTISTFSSTPAPTPSTASSAVPRGVSSSVQRLHQQQLRAFELAVLLCGDHRADDARYLHGSSAWQGRLQPVPPKSQWSTMPTMPASTGGSAG